MDEKIKIVLIEDNPGDARLIAEMLKEGGAFQIELECFDRLSTGLKRLAEGKVDAVLLDMGLPDSQGLDTLRKAYAQAPEVPIVVLTGLADEIVGFMAIHEGAQDYLVKGHVDGNLLTRSLRYAIKRKQAEEALRESEGHYRNLVELSPMAIAIHSEGKIVFANTATAKLIGASNPEQLIGKKIMEFVHPESRELVKERILQMTNEGKVVPPVEEKFIRLDGLVIDVEVAAMPFTYKGMPGMQVVIHDITERKRAEQIRLENERLTYANKAKSDFLASMSHELRTPLNAVIGFSELLKQKIAGELNEKQERYVEDILTGGKHLLNLINDILDLSKIEAGRIELIIEKLFVPQAIHEGLTLVKEKAVEHKVLLKVELDPELEFIEADILRFKQVLFNLLSNAVKFSREDGGVVTVKTRNEGDTAMFSVSDKGIGIKEEDMGKLFKEFEQISSGISRKYGGTGLGLAISKKLVELHGGKIWAESKYGEGSTFTFSVPLKKEVSS